MGSANSAAGRGPEGAVGVEQRRAVEAGAGRDLGDGRLGSGSVQAAGAAAVDELQRREGPHGGDRGGAAAGELAGGGGLEQAHGEAA